MTKEQEQEHKIERNYRRKERLEILTQGGTVEPIHIAITEAELTEWEKEIAKKQSK